MFWKNKKVIAEKEALELKDEERNIIPPILKIEIHHSKSIIDGKLYDTEKSECLSGFKDGRILFRTPKGNYFSCVMQNDSYVTMDSYVTDIVYCDIRPENIEDAKETIGKYDVERYIELFGEPEEA